VNLVAFFVSGVKGRSPGHPALKPLTITPMLDSNPVKEAIFLLDVKSYIGVLILFFAEGAKRKGIYCFSNPWMILSQHEKNLG